MNKCFFAVLFALIITFSSCSLKKEAEKPLPIKELQHFIFMQFTEEKTPAAFDRIMKQTVLQKGGHSLYLYEKLYPEACGIIDSQGFYCEALDNGDWLDKLLYELEEARMGNEILNLLEDEESLQSPVELEQAETVEKRLTDSYNRLKILEFGKERFIPVSNTDSSVFVYYADGKATRHFYDSSFRLIKKEYWNMESVANASIRASESYEYQDDSKFPYQKIIENESSKIVSNFNQDGLVIRAEKTVSELLVEVSQWKYDEQKRLIMETVTGYNYDEKTKKLKSTSEKKQLYIYNKKEEELPPDYEYYENNILKTKTVYTAKGNYSTLINFDEENSVTTWYENHIKVKDVYTSRGVQKRVRLYE